MTYTLARMYMAIDDWLEENGYDELSSEAFAHMNGPLKDPSKGTYMEYILSNPRVTLRIYSDWTVEEVEET